jgi:ATP-binding cassette subfamily G (WHITE) protein 2
VRVLSVMETINSFATLYGTVYGTAPLSNCPAFLSWQNVTVKTKNGKVELLRDVCGSVCGKLLAVMGPSGSGKTTFLNQLSKRGEDVEMDSGQLLLDGAAYTKHDIKHISAYVLQDDLMFEKMTVQEVLMFAAELMMHPTASTLDKKRRVKKIMTLLDLTECKNVIIGSPLEKGISGGQRKRTSVGVALVSRPAMLFLDEPTSGLDSVNALSLINTLRGLSHKENVTIVTTIHQPSSNIFCLFDDLLLLDHGQVVYHGRAADTAAHFSRANLPCPHGMNPAEWFLEVISSPEGKEKVLGVPDNKVVVEPMSNSDPEDLFGTPNAATTAPKRPSWWKQFALLFVRSLKLSYRDKTVVLIQLAQTIIMSLLIGGLYYQLPNTQANISVRRACLFFCVINQGVFGAMMTINVFPAERLIIARERMAGMYPVSAYFVAKNLAEVVLQVWYPLVFSLIVYWMVGLQPTARQFFIFLGFMELCMFMANSAALLIAAAAGSVILAAAVLPLAIEIARLFGGFFMPPSGLPLYFSWITAVSYCLYTYMGLMMNEFTGLVIGGCTPNAPCLNGNQVLSSLGIGYIPLYGCALVSIGLILAMRFLAYLVLLFKPL